MMLCSSTTSTVLVFDAEAASASASIGFTVATARRSTAIPSFANRSAASMAMTTGTPQATMVRSFPSRSFRAFPIASGSAPSNKTGVSFRQPRMNVGPFRRSASSSACFISTASAGTITTMLGRVRIMPTSRMA